MSSDRGGSDPTFQEALASMLRLLRARDRTRQELEQALARRGFDEPVLGRVLAHLARLGYLDDARVASARASALLERARLAPAAIQARLVALGIPEAQAQAAVQRATTEAELDERGLARRLLAQRRLDGPLTPREHARAARLLASRGFGEQLIEELLPEPTVETPGEDG